MVPERFRGKGRIIVIDDDEVTLKTISFLLDVDGHEVLVAQKSKEGLNMVIEEHPNLVILDISMPEMDGWEVLEHIRNNPAGQKIPVLMLSISANLGNIAKAYDLGADGFLAKPLENLALRETVMKTMLKGMIT
ncbi:MAG: response regulator [Elusimicrobia bacterium]|nr:response regulator [Elusimicrobiota bacterium]